MSHKKIRRTNFTVANVLSEIYLYSGVPIISAARIEVPLGKIADLKRVKMVNTSQ